MRDLIRNLLILSFTITLLACSDDPKDGGKTSENDSLEPTLKKINFIIDWQPAPTYLGIYHAIESGEFTRRGYNLDLRTSWGAHEAIAAVASGEYLMGTASGGASVLARAGGAPIKSTAVLYDETPTVVFGLASESAPSTPKDLEGLTIGIYPSSINNKEFDAFIKANNLDASKITKVPLRGEHVSRLISGELDAVVNYSELSPVQVDVNPDLPQVDGKRTWRIYLRDNEVKSYGLNLIANENRYSKNSEDIQKITDAILAGYRSACANIDEAVAQFVTRFPDISADYMRTGYTLVCQQLNTPLGHQSAAGWEKTIKLFEDAKLLDNLVLPETMIP